MMNTLPEGLYKTYVEKLKGYLDREEINQTSYGALKEVFVEANRLLENAIAFENYQAAREISDVIQSLQEKFKLIERFDDHLLMFVAHNNSAVSYIDAWDTKKSSKCLRNACKALCWSLSIKTDWVESPEIILDLEESSYLMFRPGDDLSSKTKNLYLLFKLIRVCLQACAINSQLFKHQVALTYLNAARRFNQIFIYYLQEEISLEATAGATESSEALEEASNQSSLFSDSALLNEFSKFCQIVLKDKDNGDYDDEDMILKEKAKMDSLSSKLIIGTHNKESNLKYFKAEMEKRSKALTVSKKLSFTGLEIFNIGKVMNTKSICYEDLNKEINLKEYLSLNRATQIILSYSCLLFAFATEKRFISTKTEEEKKKVANLSTDPLMLDGFNQNLAMNSNQTKTSAAGTQRDWENSKRSHLGALEVLCTFVEDCPLQEHLMSSFQKNYFNKLQPIMSENS